jgi:hypothetical protein
MRLTLPAERSEVESALGDATLDARVDALFTQLQVRAELPVVRNGGGRPD